MLDDAEKRSRRKAGREFSFKSVEIM